MEKMSKSIRILMALTVMMVSFLIPSSGKADFWSKKWSVGIHSGYALSTGAWKENRIAEDVNQFSTDFTLAVDISMKVARDFRLGFEMQYLNLNTGDWVDYVRSTGQDIRADANCWISPLTLRYSAFRDARNLLSIVGGMGLAFSGGNESFQGVTYDYDFLHGVDFLFVLGADWDLVLKPPTTFSVGGRLVLIPSGISYADGVGHTIVALPLVAGIKFYF